MSMTTASAEVSQVGPAPIVDKPMAPALADAPGAQPSPQHAWVPGHWRWLDGAYVWEAGRWELPPVAGLAWVAPQWQQQGNGYVLKEGFWQDAPPAPAPVATATMPPPAQIVVAEPPPAPQVEVIYERPSAMHVWVGGYWGWRGGRHVWVSGHWDRPPHSNAVWIAPRWERRGGNYIFFEGHWGR